jgi:hypothetical protein
MTVHHVRFAGALAALAALSVSALAADPVPGAPAGNPEVGELLEHIRRLESRVGELEREREWPLEHFRGQSSSVLEDAVRSMNISGHIEFMYAYNFRDGGAVDGRRGKTVGFSQFRGTDADAETFSMQQVQLLVDKPLTSYGSAGFRIRVDYGRVAEFNDRDPVFDGFLGLTSALEVEEVYMNYRACTFWDWMPYFDVAVGQFYSPLGFEVSENTHNWLVTRNYIHVFGTPRTHTGVRLTLPLSSCLEANLYAVNNWDNDIDVDDSKTGIANVIWEVMEGHTLTLNASYGHDDDVFGRQGNKTTFLEAIWHTQLSPDTGIALDGVWGEAGRDFLDGFGRPQRRKWRGVSAYVKHNYTQRSWVSFRADWYRDNLIAIAARTSPVMLSGSVAVGYDVAEDLTVALEFRHDHSRKDDMFLNGSGSAKNKQDTLTASLVYRF